METAGLKTRILIIDDETSFTRMVKLNLEKAGPYEVREVNRPSQALHVAREFKPDLVLLDVIMPGMDGGDIAARIKADSHLAGTPVVFLTATVAPRESGKHGLSSGGDLFLGKPCGVDTLIQCINEHARKPAEVPIERPPEKQMPPPTTPPL